jgi:drug/metabolite transporter (DMT)-like permease
MILNWPSDKQTRQGACFFVDKKVILLFASVVLIFGLNYVFVGIGLKYSPPIWLAFFRALFGFAGVAISLPIMKIKGFLTTKQKLIALILGLPGSVLFFGLWFLSGRKVLPGLTSVIIYTFPLWIAFLSIPFLGERPKNLRIGAVIFGFLGVALASRIGFEDLGSDAAALAGLAVAGFCFACFTIAFKKFFKGEQLLRANLWQLLGSLLPLIVWATLSSSFQMVTWTFELVVVILWIGILGTAVAFILWMWLLWHYKASSLGAFSFLSVAVALVSSVLINREELNLIQVLGIGAIFVSIYIVSKT